MRTLHVHARWVCGEFVSGIAAQREALQAVTAEEFLRAVAVAVVIAAAARTTQASSAALKLGGWAVAAHHRQPLRAAARGLTGSSVARVAGGGRVRRHVPDLARPQDTFPDPVDNSEAPWSPAKFPHLAAQLSAAADSSASSSAVGVHPYRAELGSLQYQPWQLQKKQQQQQPDTAAAVDVMDLESVPVTLVDTPEGLAAMVSALQGVRQVALDLEHHAYR